MIACCPTMTRAISARSRSIVSWAAAIWALTVFWSIALQFILRREAPKDLRWHSGLARRALLVACASLCYRRSFRLAVLGVRIENHPSAQVALEPVASQTGHRLQRAGLLEEVSCAGHDDDFTRRSHPLVGLLIHLNYRLVIPADNEERGSFYVRECRAGQIGASAARDDCGNPIGQAGRGNQRRAGSGAGPEKTHFESLRCLLAGQPLHRGDQAIGQQLDVESQMRGSGVDELLFLREQIEKQRSHSTLPRHLGHVSVA